MPDLAQRLAALPRIFDHRLVIADVFDDDEDAFFAAWASGALPLHVRQECSVSLAPRTVEIGLLRILFQQLGLLVSLQRDLLEEIRRAPEVDPDAGSR